MVRALHPHTRGPRGGLFKCKAVNKSNFLKTFLTLFKVNTCPAMQFAEFGPSLRGPPETHVFAYGSVIRA